MEQSFESLDVGCGVNFKGTVNLDKHKNINLETSTPFCYMKKNIPNFVLADAQYLPFNKRVFNKVICHHVIEHIKNPYKLIEELKRVVKKNGVIEIKCPHRFSKNAKNPFHIQYFSITWFNKIFDSKKNWVDISLTYWFPFHFLGFRLIDEITIIIRKREIK